MTDSKKSTLWSRDGTAGARGTDRDDDWVHRFTVGDDYMWDRLLLPFDVEATRAHAEGLQAADILDADELHSLEVALDLLEADLEAGHVTVTADDEDAHTVIELYLTDHAGDVGKKVHTGRSRNDQVLAALRLFLRARLRGVGALGGDAVAALLDLAESYADDLMPGYTHMQRAMPSTAGHWAASYAELLLDDLDLLGHAVGFMARSPLGSAAGYGVPHLNLQRDLVAEKLGFDRVQRHVGSVQLSRGKMELVAGHALLQLAATFNRMASDLVLFYTSEFGFVRLPPETLTGSSIMPQKRNPDVLELVRAAYHRIMGDVHVLMTLPANLPSGYHRDLQFTKAAIMSATLTTEGLTEAMARLLPGVAFDRKRMSDACSPEIFATARAVELVGSGLPFRDAYRQAAGEAADGQIKRPADALAHNLVDGFPGRDRLDELRARQEALSF